MRLLVASFAGMVAIGFVPVTAAQGIVDPTRPPPGWLAGESSKADPKAPAKTEEAGSVPVQLLLVGKTRRYAIVRGELVGEKTGETKLVEVKRNDVTVQSEKGRETLNLFPDVEKAPPRKPAGMGTPEGPLKKEQK
jgi:hypothetical protein